MLKLCLVRSFCLFGLFFFSSLSVFRWSVQHSDLVRHHMGIVLAEDGTLHLSHVLHRACTLSTTPHPTSPSLFSSLTHLALFFFPKPCISLLQWLTTTKTRLVDVFCETILLKHHAARLNLLRTTCSNQY